MEQASVCCVVVNWNGARDTLACLAALRRQTYPGLRVLVVDNGSTDGSAARIRADWPDIPLIEAGANRGFAAGCNLGIAEALRLHAGFVWLLNNDALPPPETLELLVQSAGEGVGGVGSVLRYPSGRVQARGGGTVGLRSGYVRHFASATDVRWGPGSFLTFASVLVRSAVFREVGMLDEGYFLYFEDADFCRRMRAAGWGMTVAAEAVVVHREGGSAAVDLAEVYTASGVRFLRRHAGNLAAIAFVALRLGKRLVRGDWRGMRLVWRGARGAS
jgi:GT2 family glycosyltransferase